jgi:STE24 endopeptidase
VEAALAPAGVGGWWRLLALVLTGQLALAFLWPQVVAPALCRQRPLPPGPLGDRLGALAESAGVKAGRVRLVDGQGSGCQAAQVVGLLRPLVLIDAALCERFTAPEVEAMVAHELGHVRRRHLLGRLAISLAFSVVQTLPLLALLLWPAMLASFGFTAPSPHGAVGVVVLCGGAFMFWVTPLGAWLSRRQEVEADEEAVRLTGCPEALGAALLDLAEDHLSDPAPHPWSVAWRFSHPPLAQRLLTIAHAASER